MGERVGIYQSIISNVCGILLLDLEMYVVSTRLASYEYMLLRAIREEGTRLLSFR